MKPEKPTPMDQASLQRHQAEVRLAVATFPGMEIGEAYRKWKEARGEKPELVFKARLAGDPGVTGDMLRKIKERPCTREGCTGVQILEGVCTGCVEGRAGYRTKWTCNICMHRELSKEDFMTWIKRLSSS